MARTDLNLIVIFDAIMQEQSITAAAEQLAMTQPSVSNAVGRMRQTWNDPLFVKDGRGIRPTEFAKKLWKDVRGPLAEIQRAENRTPFDIRESKRCFRITLTDWVLDQFWLPLRKAVEREAPGIDLHAIPYSINGESLLRNADVDMVLDYFEGEYRHIRSQLMFYNHFVCAMRAEHPLAGSDIKLDDFVAAEHLLMSLSGDASGSVDQALAEIGRKRRISVTVNHCSAITPMLENTDLITTIPRNIIHKPLAEGRLFSCEPPVPILPGPISMAWHMRSDRDPEFGWLRETVLRVLHEKLNFCLPTNES